ncbi:uncharacterized protein [Channa argus]|uniref:uncharacterized protein isoform X3 n=1 Tax=Channa argus TaxID=215402 RepID=UPI00352016C9
MKLLLSSLLLASLCALSSWSVSSGSFDVTQSHDVSVMEGDTVDISCCWMGTAEKIRVIWLKNPTEIKNETKQKNQTQIKNETKEITQSVKNETSICWNLTFSNIRPEDSGTYICKVTVEIPVYKSSNGSTVITVMTREEMKDKTEEAAVATVVPLLLITVCCYYILRRKQAQSARVIYEVPHIDSEEADMDKHSTSSSRGSSQWVSAVADKMCISTNPFRITLSNLFIPNPL